MGRYRLTRHIDAPPEHVYDALVDPATMKDWMEMQEVRDLTGDGGTHLELETEYGFPFGPIGRLLDRLFLERQPRTIANREIDRLVALVEAAGG